MRDGTWHGRVGPLIAVVAAAALVAAMGMVWLGVLPIPARWRAEGAGEGHLSAATETSALVRERTTFVTQRLKPDEGLRRRELAKVLAIRAEVTRLREEARVATGVAPSHAKALMRAVDELSAAADAYVETAGPTPREQ